MQFLYRWSYNDPFILYMMYYTIYYILIIYFLLHMM